MQVPTTGAAASARDEQAMTIDLAELLGFQGLSQLNVDVAQRDDVKASAFELSATQQAALAIAVLVAARTPAGAVLAATVRSEYQLTSAQLARAQLTSTLPGATQTAPVTAGANRTAGTISQLTPAVSSAARAATRAATQPAAQGVSAAQKALEQETAAYSAAAPAAALPALATISNGRPAAATRSARTRGQTLAATTPSETQLGAAQRTT
jgi:hypothetical protein